MCHEFEPAASRISWLRVRIRPYYFLYYSAALYVGTQATSNKTNTWPILTVLRRESTKYLDNNNKKYVTWDKICTIIWNIMYAGPLEFERDLPTKPI